MFRRPFGALAVAVALSCATGETVQPKGDGGVASQSPSDVTRSANESGVGEFVRLQFTRREADAISSLVPDGQKLPWYGPHAAPELVETGEASAATDIFAMGMTLAHLLTGGTICRPR